MTALLIGGVITSVIITNVVKSTVLLAAAAAAGAVMHRRASASLRHLLWMMTIAAILLLPVLSFAVPRWQVAIPLTPEALRHHLETGANAPHRPEALSLANVPASPASSPDQVPNAMLPVPGMPVLGAAYALVLMVILIRLIASRWAIQRLARRARSVTDPLWIALLDECTRLMRVERPVRLLRSDEHVMPMTLGTRIPTIVIPAIADLWDDERRRAVLLHELAHVERRDCSTQLLASIACAVYWVHPGVWWAARRLRVERELACDDRVLTSGVRAHEYAGHLLELAYAAGGRRAPALVVAMARPRQLETRLRAAMDPERRRTVPGLRTSVAAIVLGAAVLLPLASVQAAATPSAPRARQNAAASPIPAPTRGSGQSTTEADADPLARARNHGVTPRYITEIRELGYESLPLDELIRARDHGITPGYIRDLRQLGYRMSMEDLLTARDHGIVPEYIAGLRALGYSDMPAADLIRLRDHGIVPEYVQELNALGYQRISRDDIVRLRDHGVTPDYVRKVKAYGYTNPTIDDLISLRDKGEPRDLWDRITDHLSRLTLRDLHNALLRLFDDAHLGVLGRHD